MFEALRVRIERRALAHRRKIDAVKCGVDRQKDRQHGERKHRIALSLRDFRFQALRASLLEGSQDIQPRRLDHFQPRGKPIRRISRNALFRIDRSILLQNRSSVSHSTVRRRKPAGQALLRDLGQCHIFAT